MEVHYNRLLCRDNCVYLPYEAKAVFYDIHVSTEPELLKYFSKCDITKKKLRKDFKYNTKKHNLKNVEHYHRSELFKFDEH